MILITLVENAFKHGVMATVEKSWIELLVNAEMGISISVRNSSRIQNLSHGIGLENLKNQLDYLYKNNYRLKIANDVGVFTVDLFLKNEV
jgi:sensor histidine kinase YesM